MADVPGVAYKVQGYLQALLGRVTLEGEGEFSVQHGSSRSFIRVWSPRPDDPEARTFVRIMVPLLLDVPESPELNEYVAFHGDDYILGHLSLYKTPEGELRVFFTHSLLGDYLDQAELENALFAILKTADDLDNELQGRFGGVTFHETDD